VEVVVLLVTLLATIILKCTSTILKAKRVELQHLKWQDLHDA